MFERALTCRMEKSPPTKERGKRLARSVNINAREDSLQYVSRYINHKHGIKTASGAHSAVSVSPEGSRRAPGRLALGESNNSDAL